ncbi:MAG: Ig-like domain-containing protein [Nitrospirae bacterium]|nr:Ig-like domain-containing protein [Nitrospirota bacterium]
MEELKISNERHMSGNYRHKFCFIFVLLLIMLMGSVSSFAAINVTVSGPGGKASQDLPDEGGEFDLNIPLNKNAVNTITVRAEDSSGHTAERLLEITQLSLDQVVVSKITTERLSVQEVEQLVADGVIDLDDPENYHVSTFNIVLTIDNKPVAISVPVALPVDEPQGWETYKMPKGGDDGGGNPNPPPPPEIVIFEASVPGPPGEPDVSIPGVIVIEGNIKSLKEFFSVRLLLMNTSGIFTLSDVTAAIEFPEGGLSSISPADGIISFGDILPGDGDQPGQEEKEYVIRGDEIGVRDVKVSYGGYVTGPGIPEDGAIPFNGSAMAEVEVKGPPTFDVRVSHPDFVESNVPYELKVQITNTGDIAAMYASLGLDVGADAWLLKCDVDEGGEPVCEVIEGPEVRSLGHILPGEQVTEVFTVNPLKTGQISSCVGAADQNINLKVYVGTIGCMVGQFPPDRVPEDGSPAVYVLPVPNETGIHPDSPVTAFFSELMNEDSITTGENGAFNVFDSGDNLIAGQLRFTELNEKTVAIWQSSVGSLAGNKEFTVVITENVYDLEGNKLSARWESTFTTTGTGPGDITPPEISLSVEPPVAPEYVLPGQLVKVEAYTADQGSGVSRVEARIKDLDEEGAQYALIDQKKVFEGDLPPFIFTIDSANLVPGHSYQMLATAYDGAGNRRDTTISLIMALTAGDPTITLPDDPAQPVLHGISVDITPRAWTGGVREVGYYLDGDALPFKTMYLAPYTSSLKTLGLALGDHVVRAVATDALAKTGEDIMTFTLAENLNMPVVSFTNAEDGQQFLSGGPVLIQSAVSDDVGVKSVKYFLDDPTGSPLYSGVNVVTLNIAGLETGEHELYILATNNLDISNDINDPASYLEFSVVEPPPGVPPDAPSIISVSHPENGVVTITGSSVPGALIRATELNTGLTVSVSAGGSGGFTINIEASTGDTISIVAYDLNESADPSAPVSVVVPAPPVLDHIEVTPAVINFTAVNQSRNLAVTAHYQDGAQKNVTAQSTYSSDNPSVASVGAAGKVVGLSYGSAAITVIYGGLQGQVTVNADIVTLDSITVDPQRVELAAIGQTAQLIVTGHYSNGTSQVLNSGISFISGDNATATVNSSGVITAKRDGGTQINVYGPGIPAVSVDVAVNTALDPAPTVGILSPAGGSDVERGEQVSVRVRAQDELGGVSKVFMEVSGEASYSDMKQISPASADTTQNFAFNVSGAAAVGGAITVNVRAEDTGGNTSGIESITLNVVDNTAPSIAITEPAHGTPFNYGDTVNINISASDAVGVTEIRYETTGALTLSGSQAIAPAAQAASASFSFDIPFGISEPGVTVRAYARDEAGNERAAIPVDFTITDADITPPETVVTSIDDPGLNASTTITYQVVSGLEDLDHVELYFRRNGIGTFNRYTNADAGNAEGKFSPQNGDTGTIVFDSTKMGGDGDYEFYSVGVDKAGNRESAPDISLVAYYPFNGNANDESGRNNNGSVTGATLTVDGNSLPDSAYSFDGSGDFVNVQESTVWDLGLNNFTLNLWVKLNQVKDSMFIYQQSGSSSGGFEFDFQQHPVYGPNLVFAWNPYEGVVRPWTPEPNRWYALAVTRENGVYRLYVDGVQLGSEQYDPNPVADVNGSIRIGTYSSSEFDVDGSIDEVALFSRSLSAAEIQDIYQNGMMDIWKATETATFNAGTVWTTINAPTVIGEGDATFDNKNLRISGATVTVNGTHSFKNIDLLNGAALTHSDTDTAQEFSLNISAWSLSIDGTSSLDVTGKGYIGGRGYYEQGRTAGNVYGSGGGAGGSYGGVGGSYSGAIPNSVYGYLTDPQELGSGGGSWGWTIGGDGGGLIKLNTINITVDGAIKSNGGESDGSAAGDGSGGGINISTATLSGSGSIMSNGGGSGNGTGAGGGRIAINYTDMATLDQGNVKALGGFGQYGNGSNGTVVFIQSNKAELVITGQGPSSPWTNLTIPPGYVFDSVTLRDNARVIAYDPFSITGKLLVTGNSILTHNNGNENGLVINAAAVQVDEGSSIDVTGRGNIGGRGYSEQGRTLGNVYGSGGGAGGSYGGGGAGYQGNSAYLVYGDPKNPVYLGSGGGSWGWTIGGDGGGRITINASQSVTVNGSISAKGGESEGSAAGDGSGGSVLINTSKLAGNGFIAANGGGNGNGTGGGGGRVAVYCDYVDPNNNLNNLYNITSFGGRGYYDERRSTTGTVYVKYGNQENGNLYIDSNEVDANGNPNGTAAQPVVLTPIGFGTIADVTSDTLTTDGLVSMLPGSLPGLRINPDINQGETFIIQSNTGNTITVSTPNENGANFSDIAGAGKTYSGYHKYDNLIFRRGGYLMAGDLFEITDTMNISEYGMLTHYDISTSFISWLDLKVKNLHIDPTGRIDVTGRGYIGGRGYSEQGRTLGNVYGANGGAGGSYGGLAAGHEGSVSNSIYGSLTNPVDFGSGGGSWGWTIGGDGGGLIFIRADNITLDGAIISNGGESDGSAAGDGSGGTVNVVTGNLSGTGSITANGGGNGNGSGAGGGRISITLTGDLTVPEQNFRAVGGTGYYGSPGGNGTVYIKRPGQTFGNLIIDGFGNSTPNDTTRIPGGYTFDNITIKNSARAIADEVITTTGRLLITGNSVLSHGKALEAGLVINAQAVQIDTGSSIDVKGKGYTGGAGYSEQGRTLGNVYGSSNGAGGSYGGLGAGYQNNSAYLVYGDPKYPVYIGSGGGAWGWNPGGSGGGRITVNASQEVIADGIISADGSTSGGSAAGAGSGGSILINTSLLSGDGFITANGGGEGNGVGGGGGRVAVYADLIDPGSNLNNLYNITAFGGRGYSGYDDRKSSAGTVYIKYTGGEGSLYIDNNVVDGNGNPNGASPESTPLTPIGFGTTVDVTPDTLTTDGLMALLPGGLSGLRINPDISQAETFAILSNSANTIIVKTPNENGLNFSNIAGAGKSYAGVYKFDNMTFRRGGYLIMGDFIEIANTMTIAEYGMLTHYDATAGFTSRLDLTVGNLSIDATGRIDVTGRGYIGGRGYNEQGRTLGNVYGSSNGAGGSYGGLGGAYSGNSNPVYGSVADPVDLGSGGGSWGWPVGGDGGGLILIEAGSITLDGAIISNGGESGGSAAGDGSGGAVNISATNITGTGIITANGGGNGTGVGGGGGRVAVYYDSLALPLLNINSLRGTGYYGSGQDGTVYLQQQ